jgi:HEAT repeat protein
LRNESLTCLGDVRSSALARTTALQVCALLREDRVLARAEQLAQTAENVALRVSGIAAVGALGGPGDRAILSGLLADENPSIRAAATTAMQALTDRFEGAGL